MQKPDQTFHFLPGRSVLLCIFALAQLCLVLACQRSSSSVASSALRMVEGQSPGPDSPARWSTVALLDRKGRSFCSGTLIAPELVLTAAHCVFDKEPAAMQVAFDPAPEKNPAAVKRPVLASQTFKKGQKYESNFDVAWVRFEGTAPAPYRPLEIWHGAAALQPGKPLTIAGYGRTASICAGRDPSCEGGTLLEVNSRVREFVDRARLYDLIVIEADPAGEKPPGPCFGDSGGPAYLKEGEQWYVVGDFMGWDRILVPEEQDTICDHGAGIYNFVGSYAAWIEASSGVSLSFDPVKNPRPTPETLPTLAEEPADFQGWCAYSNHEDPAWYTVQRLLRLASDFRLTREGAAAAREVFEDCKVAAVWLQAMLEADPHLVIAGYDPQHFIDRAPIEDVRPLASLAAMQLKGLTLSDHAIADLSPLMRIASLEELEILDNVPRTASRFAPEFALRIQELKSLKSLKVHNSTGSIDFGGLGQLLGLVDLDLASLPLLFERGEPLLLENPALERLSLDSLETPVSLKNSEQLRELRMRRTPLSLPPRLPALQSLELFENPELSALPREMPELKILSIYDSGLSGVLALAGWKNLENISLVANAKLSRVEGLVALSDLKKIEITDNKLASLGAIAELPLLRELLLARNGLSALPELSALPGLQRLDLEGNSLKAIPSLKELESLEWLNLNKNPLADLKGVGGLKKLKRMTARNQSGKGLTSLAGLEELPLLEDLNLGRNALKDLRPLAALTQMRVLVLSDNLIEDVSVLSPLVELEYLELVNNPLKEKRCPSPQPNVCRFEWLVISGFGDLFPPH